MLVFVMVCNGLLTCMAMLRYSARTIQPESRNLLGSLVGVAGVGAHDGGEGSL